MADIVIQNILPQDLNEIIQIGLSTPQLHLQDQTLIYYSKEALESFIKSPNDIYLVAKIDGEIAGYRLATYNPYLKEAYLIDIVVKPEYQGAGVASALYKKTFEILRSKGCFWTWTLVKENNLQIRAILKKKGFKQGANFTAFYKEGPF